VSSMRCKLCPMLIAANEYPMAVSPRQYGHL
jgi:hypothetical protein